MIMQDNESPPELRMPAPGQDRQPHHIDTSRTLIDASVSGGGDNELVDLFAVLGHDFGTDSERVVINHKIGDGPMRYKLLPAVDAQDYVNALPGDADVWFNVNPVQPDTKKRGTAADVTRLAALIADLDIKPGACPDENTARAIITEVSAALGEPPNAIVHSGHGLHPYWTIRDGHIGDVFTRAAAEALLARHGRLVAKVAAGHGVKLDSVYDLPRMLRVPGTTNHKDPENPVRARLTSIFCDADRWLDYLARRDGWQAGLSCC
jgi:hypothetical protein